MNDEMVMKRRGGTKSKTVGRMLNKICKYLAGACNSNSHARGIYYLTFVCNNKAGKSSQ
jgi:hypothetical protein